MQRALRFALFLTGVLVPALAFAGGGPETTVVVVNGDSAIPRRVANEYVHLRDIPDGHVVVLSGVPDREIVTLAEFRDLLWKPVREHLEREDLDERVDLVAWSAGFPFAVDFRKELGDDNPGHVVGGLASLTGATYLHQRVEAGEPFWGLEINRYFRMISGGGGSTRNPTAEERAHAAAALKALQAGDHGEAAKAYEALTASWPWDASAWYNLACCRALLGRKDAALDALERAADAGFRDAAHAEKDPDLTTLRQEKRFSSALAAMAASVFEFHPARGFRSDRSWTGAAEPAAAGEGEPLDRDRLSTMLAWTGKHGNSLPEILGYLRSAAASDGTRPEGTVYLCRNKDVRSTTREPFFASVVRGLARLGRKVEILDKGEDGQTGVIPVGKEDVVGAVVGIANFDWAGSKSRLLPGAIAEHLTSFGGAFQSAGQTKLTEFLRHGAAGASGTVREPLALHQKFPNPMIHAFYAEGCSLAEAFFQSVAGPYQLLVVGDGLARPFAVFPEFEVEAPRGSWKGTVDIVPSGEGVAFQLWVDGRFVAAGGPFALDTTALEDGYHDVRVVATAEGPVATRAFRRVEGVVRNHGALRRIETPKPDKVLLFQARGASEIRVLQQGRVVGEAKGSRVEISPEDVGEGPVRLVAVAVWGGMSWRAEPVDLRLGPAEPTGGGPPKKK